VWEVDELPAEFVVNVMITDVTDGMLVVLADVPSDRGWLLNDNDVLTPAAFEKRGEDACRTG
jgi:hypothetical protein